jgi:hypothetical protein
MLKEQEAIPEKDWIEFGINSKGEPTVKFKMISPPGSLSTPEGQSVMADACHSMWLALLAKFPRLQR